MAARSLRSGESNFVLFLIPEEVAVGTAALGFINALTVRMAPHGLDLITRRVSSGRPVTRLWQDLGPTAIVGLGLSTIEIEQLSRAGLTVIDIALDETDIAIGALQVHHLLGRGHTRLAYVAPSDPDLSGYSEKRLAGVTAACREQGLVAPPVLTLSLDADHATTVIGRLRREHPEVTGLCSYNDDYAFAVLSGLAGLALTTPGDLAVIGADDIPLAAVAIPALTTIAVQAEMVDQVVHEILAGRARPGWVWSQPAPDLHVIERHTV